MELCPPETYVEGLTPASECDLVRKRIFADIIKLKGHSRAGWALVQYDKCLCKKRRGSDTVGECGEVPHGDDDRDRGDMYPRLGAPGWLAAARSWESS